MDRRLAAVIAADVVGYSRLIRADEEGTLAVLNAIRKDLIGPKASRTSHSAESLSKALNANILSRWEASWDYP